MTPVQKDSISSGKNLLPEAAEPVSEVDVSGDTGNGEYLTAQLYTSSVAISVEEKDDRSLVLYRHPYTRDYVVDFYVGLTGSEEISSSILKWADMLNIPLSLAFSLAWVESGFSIYAVNTNPSSVDRGLFQLNSRSFPDLEEADFFDPALNAELGLKYLKRCIDISGNEIVGLAMYNAGRTRVERGGTPVITLEYISKILDYRDNLEQNFEQAVMNQGIVLESKPPNTLVLLKPDHSPDT